MSEQPLQLGSGESLLGLVAQKTIEIFLKSGRDKSGITEGVEIRHFWLEQDSDGQDIALCVVFDHPTRYRLTGMRRESSSLPFIDDPDIQAVDLAVEIAEPIGNSQVVIDEYGINWWGDNPLPPVAWTPELASGVLRRQER